MDTVQKQSQLNLDVLGTTGLKVYGGVVYEEWMRRLHGKQAILTYREMADNSTTVGAVLFAIQNLIRNVKWRIESEGDSPESKEPAEFVDGCLEDMSHTFDDFLVEALSMLPYGWSYHELVYKVRRGPDSTNPSYRSKYDDGKIGWRKIPVRSQDTFWQWELDPEDNGVRGLWQADPCSQKMNVFIPIEKALLFRSSGQKNNPEGRSILRTAVADYLRLKRVVEIEAIGIERDMTGLLHMQVPTNILEAQAGVPAHATALALRQDLEKMLSSLKRDQREFAMTPPEIGEDGKPSGYKLSLLATGGRRQIDTNSIVLRYMNGITMSMLADFLMLGSANVGSWALSSDKTRLFAFALGAIMESIADVFNRFAIPRLMQLNGVPSRLWPHMVHGDIETPPLADVGAYITALATAGMLKPTSTLERKLLEIGNLPPPPIEDEDMPLPGEGQPAEPAPEGRPLETSPESSERS